MALIRGQPKNINFLSPLGFRFRLTRAPNLGFFVTSVVLPNITLNFVDVPTPFKAINIAGNKLEYGDLQITFRLDEDFDAYFEIYNWLVSLGFPENFDQYRIAENKAKGSPDGLYSDAVLSVLTSDMVANIEIDFQDLFPASISDINFNVSDTDVNYVEMTVTFKYKIYHVRKIKP